jgi:GNAT superfamily N-acetyltransferase
MSEIRPLATEDRARARAFILDRWGDDRMVADGGVFRPAEHEGFVAGDWVGLATYRIDGPSCELTLIDVVTPGVGLGTRLLDAVIDAARAAGCTRVWCTSTNDNLPALAFYERRGFVRVTVREGAVDETRRRHKPSIPPVNTETGLPIRDEIDLSREL